MYWLDAALWMLILAGSLLLAAVFGWFLGFGIQLGEEHAYRLSALAWDYCEAGGGKGLRLMKSRGWGSIALMSRGGRTAMLRASGRPKRKPSGWKPRLTAR